jgi:hypothetical protein
VIGGAKQPGKTNDVTDHGSVNAAPNEPERRSLAISDV